MCRNNSCNLTEQRIQKSFDSVDEHLALYNEKEVEVTVEEDIAVLATNEKNLGYARLSRQ